MCKGAFQKIEGGILRHAAYPSLPRAPSRNMSFDPYKTPRTDIPLNARLYGTNAHLNWTLEFRMRLQTAFVKGLSDKQLKTYYASEQKRNSQLTEYEHLHTLKVMEEEIALRATAKTSA